MNKDSIVYAQGRQQKDHEMASRALSSLPMMEVLSAMADYVNTTYGKVRPISRTSDCSVTKNVGTLLVDDSLMLCTTGLFHPNPLNFTTFVCIGDNCTYLGGGKWIMSERVKFE